MEMDSLGFCAPSGLSEVLRVLMIGAFLAKALTAISMLAVDPSPVSLNAGLATA